MGEHDVNIYVDPPAPPGRRHRVPTSLVVLGGSGPGWCPDWAGGHAELEAVARFEAWPETVRFYGDEEWGFWA